MYGVLLPVWTRLEDISGRDPLSNIIRTDYCTSDHERVKHNNHLKSWLSHVSMGIKMQQSGFTAVTVKLTYRSNDVCTQQPVSYFISKDFHKSISIIVSLGPAVCSKREFSNLILNTLKSKNEFKYKTANLMQFIFTDMMTQAQQQ
jgi:hypothetical protein